MRGWFWTFNVFGYDLLVLHFFFHFFEISNYDNIRYIETFHNLNLMLEFMFFIDFLIDHIFVIDFLIIFGKVMLISRIIFN